MLSDNAQSSQLQRVSGGPGMCVLTPDPEVFLWQCTARIWHLLSSLKSFLETEYWWLRHSVPPPNHGKMSASQNDEEVPCRDWVQFFSVHSHFKCQVKSYQNSSSEKERPLAVKTFSPQGSPGCTGRWQRVGWSFSWIISHAKGRRFPI